MTTAEAVIPEGGWLAMMPRAARARVIDLTRSVTVPAGTAIIREGERARSMGVVVSGRLALQLFVPGREAVTVATVEPGDVYGISALVPPHGATMTVKAVGPAVVLEIDVEGLRKAFADDCELTAAVYFAISRALQGRLTATTEVLLDLADTDHISN